MKKYFLYLYCLIFIFAGCSQYEKILKGNDYALKYKKAFEYYHKADFVRASALFEQIVAVYRGSIKGDSVNFYLAKSYYNEGDYMMAAEYFQTFTETYSRSPFIEQAAYLKGISYYKLSPRPELDQTNTRAAIVEFELFVIKFPQSQYVPDCKRYAAELHEKLVEKSFINAKLYFNLRRYKASIIALRNSMNEYPESRHREELKFLLLKSCFLLADKSIIEKQKERFQDALDEYYSFIDEFPTSKYKKEADRMFASSTKMIGKDSNN